MALSPAQAARLLKKRKAAAFDVEDLFDKKFPQQTAFIRDPSKLKALFCTRRAAKSYTAGTYLVYEALTNPGVNCLFVGLTRSSAKGIIWKDILKVVNRKFKLKAKFNLATLTVSFPNGSVISVTGADSDEDEMNKLLGRKYRLVCIDEASMYTIDMHKLVYGILKPAMADLGGTICLMGTASNFTRGLFYDITNKKEAGWTLHSWTAHDNPHVAKQWQQELDEIKKLRPMFMETPLFKQWYLNLWVVDNEKLVYKFNEERNLYIDLPHLPTDGWIYVLGVDTGWEDDNAFVLTGYHEKDKNLYVIKTYNRPHMTFDMVVTKIQEFMADPIYRPSKVIIDGANKQGVESMRQRSQIPFEYADKTGKVDFIEMLNADLIQQKIKISSKCNTLIDEMMGLVWMTDGDKIRLPKREHPSLSNHLCDSFLYAWRNGYHYVFQPKIEGPKTGSKEWAKAEEELMKQMLYQQIKEEESQLHDQLDPYGLNEDSQDLSKWRRS